mgnify:CR=1 FL=1
MKEKAKAHYNLAVHNYRFFCQVHEKLPDIFYDWKITVLFYSSVHLLRALMAQRDVDVGDNHEALKRAINPNNSESTLPVKEFCYQAYLVLYNTSFSARYQAWLDRDKRKKRMAKDFEKCKKAFNKIDSYVNSQDFPQITIIQQEFEFKE